MSVFSLKVMLPVFRYRCQALAVRRLHVSASPLSDALPSKRGQGKPVSPPNPKADSQIQLEANFKSGLLALEPAKAVAFTNAYISKMKKNDSDSSWIQKLCDEHQIKPGVLVQLAEAHDRAAGPGQRLLARQLLASASALGEPSGTLKLVSLLLANGGFDSQAYSAPLQHLGILAKKDRNPQAMLLLGKILQGNGKEREALVWFRKAIEASDTMDFEGAAEALVSIGRSLLNENDVKGAEEVLRKAALELDDATAYFYLARTQPHASPQQKVYLLKAAASGIVEAHHNLGALELARAQEESEKVAEGEQAKPVDYRSARDWFEVAAAEGYGLSMLNLAQICLATGQKGDGLKWLERAAMYPEFRSAAAEMRESFA